MRQKLAIRIGGAKKFGSRGKTESGDQKMDRELEPLPASIGKPVIVLEIILRLRKEATKLRRKAIRRGAAFFSDAAIWDQAAEVVKKEFLK